MTTIRNFRIVQTEDKREITRDELSWFEKREPAGHDQHITNKNIGVNNVFNKGFNPEYYNRQNYLFL